MSAAFADVASPLDMVSPVFAPSPFGLPRRQRFWELSEDRRRLRGLDPTAAPHEMGHDPPAWRPGIGSPARVDDLEKRTNYMRFGASKLDENGKVPAKTSAKKAKRRLRATPRGTFDPHEASRRWADAVEAASDAQRAFERLLDEGDNPSDETSPARAGQTAAAWKLGFT